MTIITGIQQALEYGHKTLTEWRVFFRNLGFLDSNVFVYWSDKLALTRTMLVMWRGGDFLTLDYSNFTRMFNPHDNCTQIVFVLYSNFLWCNFAKQTAFKFFRDWNEYSQWPSRLFKWATLFKAVVGVSAARDSCGASVALCGGPGWLNASLLLTTPRLRTLLDWSKVETF